MTKPATVSQSVDADGTPVVHIETSNRPGRFVTMDQADWSAWLAAGRPPSIFLFGNGSGREYVGYSDATRPGWNAPAARAIVGAPPGRVVRSWDGDPLNLRRRNLYTLAGKAGPRRSVPKAFINAGAGPRA
jgi:hypothetical protein